MRSWQIFSRAWGVEFGAGENKIPIDKEHIAFITKKRNTFFHGSQSEQKKQKKSITVEEAVTWLMYICPEIIRYVMVNPPTGV